MKVFAFDTALGACSVACLVDGRPAAMRFELMVRGHAEVLMDRLAAVEEEAGLRIRQADRLAVTIGPGTFTGVRVGLSAAKALALAAAKPLFGVSTLNALAAQADFAGTDTDTVAVAVDARRGQIYFQVFDEALVPLLAPRAMPPANAARDLAGLQPRRRRILVLGSGAELLGGAGVPEGLVIDPTARQPNAVDVARIAARSPESEGRMPVRPLYLRPPDAKPQTPSRFAQELRKDNG